MIENELSAADEQKLENNLVWIFGNVRSGTTWLGIELLKYQNNVIWNEPYIGLHLAKRGRHLDREDYFFSNKYKKEWMPFVRKLILNRAYAQSKSVNSLVITKDPSGIGGVNTIMECLPNSKLILLLRDGRDVVDSLLDSHQKDSWNDALLPFSSDQDKLQHIIKYSNGWVDSTNLAIETMENRPSNLSLMVKYEDLLRDTFNELKRIYDFLKIDIIEDDLKNIIEKYDFNNIPERKKGSGKFRRSASPGKWKENLSEEEQKITQNIMKETLLKCNYEV